MKLNWIKCEGDQWCALMSVNLDGSHFDDMKGVYVIWHGGSDARTVRVGQGDIKDRLSAHRNDTSITRHGKNATLYATWAPAELQYRDGIERYLFDSLKPLEGELAPAAKPIQVNLPS